MSIISLRFIYLVEAEEGDFSTYVNSGRADAEDALLLQPTLCIDGASGDGCRQSWWHYDGHNVQRANHNFNHSGLEMKHNIRLTPKGKKKRKTETALQDSEPLSAVY